MIASSSSAEEDKYAKLIEKNNKDECKLKHNMKIQIFVTSSLIRSFNTTIQKLQIDEKDFNEDPQRNEQPMANIRDIFLFY